MNSTNAQQPSKSDQRIVDLELHQLVGIRLIDPSSLDISRLKKQCGLTQTILHKTPDISIQFIESFAVDKINYLGLNSTAYSNDQFYLLNKKNGNIQAQIPFETIGKHCKIACLTGINSIPLLSEIIMLAMMKKDYIWLHASAFSFKETAILVMGWEKGGKTETLLAFGNQGAQFIGDEMVALSSNGKKMFGIPIPMAIWEWQIKYLPNLIPTIDLQHKIIFRFILGLKKFHNIFANGRLKNFFPFQLMGDALPALKRKLKIWMLPSELFKNQQGKQGSTPNKVFLVMSHNQVDISIESCSSEEIAQRMSVSNQYERQHFFKYYQAFKFAFPHLSNAFLDTIDEQQNVLISQALAGKECYKVIHPYPVSLDDLYNKMLPFCRNKSQTSK